MPTEFSLITTLVEFVIGTVCNSKASTFTIYITNNLQMSSKIPVPYHTIPIPVDHTVLNILYMNYYKM